MKSPAELAHIEYLEDGYTEAGSVGGDLGGPLAVSERNSAHCNTQHFHFVLAPTAPNEENPGDAPLPFGHCRVDRGPDTGEENDRNGVDLACETPSGWSVEVGENFTPGISETALRTQYERLADALETPPSE